MIKVIKFLKHPLILIILMLIIGTISLFDSAQWVDKALQDYLYTIDSPSRSDNIYIIGIDNDSLNEVGPWGTWSRGVMGDLIATLDADPQNAPAVIGIDVMYFGNKEDDADGDAYLAEAAKKAGNVVVANEVVFGKKLQADGSFNFFSVKSINQPYEALKSATRQGFVNTIPDSSDNKVRKSLHKVTYNGKDYYSFASEVYRLYAEKKGLPLRNPRLNNLNQWNIEYSTGDYGGYSLSKVLSGEIPASEFKDGIVLIGPYSTGMQDGYYTPSGSNRLFGVDIHANIIQCLAEGRFKHEASRKAQTMALLMLMAVFYFCFKKLNIKLSTALLIVSLPALAVVPFLLYRSGLVISVFYPLSAVILLYVWCLISNYISEVLKRKKITGNFKKYVAPQVVETLAKGGLEELKLGGSRKDIAVLFADIRGFTNMSENMKPEQVVEILNEYFQLTTTAVFKFEGTLDKFIGDAAMAIFNAPADVDDYIFKAACTALEIQQGAEKLKSRVFDRFGIDLSFGIGLNCGNTVVGNIGTSFRMEYTAIGDAVNTASRLENTADPNQILISEAVYEKIKNRVRVTPLGERLLRGKSKEIFVYQLEGLI